MERYLLFACDLHAISLQIAALAVSAMSKILLPVVVGLLSLPLPSGAGDLTFEKDIRPIFRAHCFDCHGMSKKVEGELDLRLVRFMVKGGESGPAIEPGNPAESYLLQRVKDGEMPPGEQRVPDDQIATLQSWIANGARIARPEPASM